MDNETAAVGDVVQIDGARHPRFAGCLGIVTEVKGWGVVVDCPIPAAPVPQAAPIRLEWEAFKRIGRAVFGGP